MLFVLRSGGFAQQKQFNILLTKRQPSAGSFFFPFRLDRGRSPARKTVLVLLGKIVYNRTAFDTGQTAARRGPCLMKGE
jgi:hypothetical protein